MSLPRFIFSVLSAAAVSLATSAAAADDWQVDKAHTQVGFTVKHLGITNVRGTFKDVDATLKAGADGKVSEVTATAKTASIDTGIEARDTHLKAPDFFDAAKYPTLSLKAAKVKWKGDKFTAEADLTIRDVTRKVTFTGQLVGVHKVNFGQGDQIRAGYEASTTIKRKDFGLAFSMLAEGVEVVSEDVTIRLEVQTFKPVASQT